MISRRGFLAAGTAMVSRAHLGNAVEPPTTHNPENVKAWFDRTYCNLVVDYYTEVPERPYGTGFTRDNLLASLKLVRPGFILYYGKGHSGTTAFKSRLGTEHPKLGNDPLKVLRDVTREAGVRFCIYYSGLVDGKAGQKHPEWQACGWDGKPYGGGPPFYMIPIWPASRYFEDWVSIHLEEIMTRYDPDLIWVDGDWAGGGYCLCERCKKLAGEKFGEGAIQHGEYHLWIRNEYRRKFSALVRKYKPDCLYSAGNTTPAADTGLVNHMDWQSGDWFRPDGHRIMQSLAMRRYTTLGLPYDAITCDTQFIHSFDGARSRHKSLDCMLQEEAGVLANGGKWWYWTYPMPHGALIPSRMRQAKACHDFADERKDLWLNTQSARWTACVDSGLHDEFARVRHSHARPVSGHAAMRPQARDRASRAGAPAGRRRMEPGPLEPGPAATQDPLLRSYPSVVVGQIKASVHCVCDTSRLMILSLVECQRRLRKEWLCPPQCGYWNFDPTIALPPVTELSRGKDDRRTDRLRSPVGLTIGIGSTANSNSSTPALALHRRQFGLGNGQRHVRAAEPNR